MVVMFELLSGEISNRDLPRPYSPLIGFGWRIIKKVEGKRWSGGVVRNSINQPQRSH